MGTETLELTVFHCVVKHSSYAKAADELALSPSGVSRIVSRLEERLGARLVQRTTRKLSLTEAGAAFQRFSQNGAEQYFGVGSGSNRVDSGAARGVSYLLWGEPGFRRVRGLEFFLRVVKLCSETARGVVWLCSETEGML